MGAVRHTLKRRPEGIAGISDVTDPAGVARLSWRVQNTLAGHLYL
ncbi:protein of unknown function [Cupriavidus neocaledonicus]|uniref:Uncharacterized protein n=1 Tax=Cupriavidus neocaledonicus TaxID=1040979 RepID=A0A375HAA9_9BURK|nr:hypothetical protein CBM2605_A230125 [Cupriavidus neocaledonicus]SPD47836.1 protein of unknown function [Cupriavidus neocaledonicus]